jgi:hypothetical protein
VAVKDQPAIGPLGHVEGVFDAGRVFVNFDQRRSAQELEIDDVAVDPGQDAAGGVEDTLQLIFSRDGGEPIRIGKVLEPDGRVERGEITAVPIELVGHGRCVELNRPPVRISVAGDFVPAAMQGNDVVGRNPVPAA